ncbi:zinc finger and BTB domain-containing protein 16 [Lepisosteus oculatus]|uniref:zinc finger and BTB domain-containing protein 16 n=1 Tax=Lepisosteus oculatus TaxID=7918 RepID=UPI00371E0943
MAATVTTVRLRNPQHCSRMLRRANELRQAGTLCDAVIVVESQAFHAHSLVLACASRRLEGLLTRPGPQRCSLDFLSPRTFQQILDYAYTDTLEAPVEDLRVLLQAAQLLQMDQLWDQCHMHLQSLREADRGEAGAPREEEEEEEEKAGAGEAQEPAGAPEPSPVPGSSSPSDSPPSPKRARPERGRPAAAAPPRGSVIASTSQLGEWPAGQRVALSSADWLALHSLHARGPHHPPSLLAYPFQLAPPVFPLLAASPPRAREPILDYSRFLQPFRHAVLPGGMGVGARELGLKHGQLGKGSSASGAVMGSVPVEDQARKHPTICKTFRCEYCGKEFLDSLRLRIHSVVHSVPNPSPLCPFCRKTFDSQGALKSHLAEHTRGWNHVCQECGRPFPSHTALRRHQRSHTGELTCECDYCGRCFRDDSSLRSHKRVHTGEKPYQCESCSKRFSLKHQLDTHYRVHTGEKPFECRLCGQRSRDYSAMIKHLRTHSGAGPYQCTVCLEFCCSLSAMQKHIKTHSAQDFPPDWSINSTYLYTCHS